MPTITARDTKKARGGTKKKATAGPAFPLARMATLLIDQAVKGGMTLDQIAARGGVAVGRLYEVRKGDHGMTENSVAKVAAGLGLEPLDFYRRGLEAIDAETTEGGAS